MSDSLKKNIQALERKNRLITDQLIDAIWVVDAATLIFEYITPSIERISGYTAQEYIGHAIKDRLTAFSFLELKPLLNKTNLKKEQLKSSTRTFEVALNHKNGDTYWAEIRARLVKDEDGSLKIIGVTRNISRQKSAERKQQALIEKLENALADKARLTEEIDALRGLLPICSGCKRIRDDNGKWWPLDAYIKAHSQADLTHTICLDCKDVFYGDI